MTILGDLAQSTGDWARSSWDDVIAELQGACPSQLTELALGYRVPRQILEFAAKLLPIAAPGLSAPRVIRDGPSEPVLLHVESDDVASTTVAEARRYAGLGYSVGVICPQSPWEEVRRRFEHEGAQCRDVAKDGIGSGINLLRPTQAKGLEFDAVVVVEPELIMKEAEPGARLLYIALTRTTTFLSVVHVGEALPITVAAGPGKAAAAPEEAVAGQPLNTVAKPPRVVTILADALADEIRTSLPPGLWDELIADITQKLHREVGIGRARVDVTRQGDPPPPSAEPDLFAPEVAELISREAPPGLAPYQMVYAERCARELEVTSRLKGGQSGSYFNLFPPPRYGRKRASAVETHTGRCDIFVHPTHADRSELAEYILNDGIPVGLMIYLRSEKAVEEAIKLTKRGLEERSRAA
jgi:hypothetical protein